MATMEWQGRQYMFTLCVCIVIGDGRGQHWDGRGLWAIMSGMCNWNGRGAELSDFKAVCGGNNNEGG